MPSSHLNHQVRQWCGVQNGQKWIGLYKEVILWTTTSNSFIENEEYNIPSQILKTIFGLHASVIFYTQICVVSNTFVGSCDPKLYWSISRTNCLYYSTRVDLYSYQILLDA